MLNYLIAKPILMDRFATQATIAHPKVINLIRIVNARAQGTNQQLQWSAHVMIITGVMITGQTKVNVTRVRCLDFIIRFSQNAKLL
jgi:hypothetical protein